MIIDDPTIVYYIKTRFRIRDAAFPPFAIAVMTCVAEPKYLNMEKELLRVVNEKIQADNISVLRRHLRDGFNRGWHLCREDTKEENCPIPLMELVRRAVEILEWVEKAPHDMACADARRIFWRDMGTVEPFPEFKPPSAIQPTIMRTIQDSPKSLVSMGDILLAACPLEDFSLGHVQYCIQDLCRMGFIQRVFDGKFDCYTLSCDPKEYWRYRRKNIIAYYPCASQEEKVVQEIMLDEDFRIDENYPAYWKCVLNAFQKNLKPA